MNQQQAETALAADVTTAEGSRLLDEAIRRYEDGQAKGINAALQKRVPQLRELLPKNLQNQSERFIKRAMLTFSRKPDLQDCTPSSFIRCVLEAAEYGFAIDGRLFHAVSYNNKKKGPDGREYWEKEAQCMPDYKGLVAVAKRTQQVVDVQPDVVCERDEFTHGRDGPNSVLKHNYDHRKPRGPVIATYCIVILPNDRWKYELMSRAEVGAIQARSMSAKSGFSPWKTDENEMIKKTVVRRALKLYCDDPGFERLLELDDRDFEKPPDEPIPSGTRVEEGDGGPMDTLEDELAEMKDAGFPQGTEAAPKATDARQPAAEPGDEVDAALERDFARAVADLDECDVEWAVDDLRAKNNFPEPHAIRWIACCEKRKEELAAKSPGKTTQRTLT